MFNTYLIVHETSYRYVTSIVDFIRSALARRFKESFEFCLSSRVEQVDVKPNSIVFVLGELFPAFRRTKGCYYVYINFSVLYNLGAFRDLSLKALQMQARKRRWLNQKISSIDCILEYYPEQIERLQVSMSLPVRQLPVAVNVAPAIVDLDRRSYDVGFVGGISFRRQAIVGALNKLGLRLSPQTGVVLEDALRQSKICLNVHIHRALHLELPRVLGAFSCGAALVTENSRGMERIFPSDIYIAAKYEDLVEVTQELLRMDKQIATMSQKAMSWLSDFYLPKCDSAWSIRLDEITERATQEG